MSKQFQDDPDWKNDSNMKKIDTAMDSANLDQAKKDIEDVLKKPNLKDFKRAHALNHLGVILHRKGQDKEAKEAFEAAIALNSKDEDVIHNLGVIGKR